MLSIYFQKILNVNLEENFSIHMGLRTMFMMRLNLLMLILGFDYFMKNTKTDKVYLMHCWNDTSISEKLKAMACSEKYRHKICSYWVN